MRVISVGKKTIAFVMTVVVAAVVFFATMIPSQADEPQPTAQPAVVLPTITLTLPVLPPVTVKPSAIIKTVTKVVKDVTVVTRTLPGTTETVTKRVVLPRSTQTVTLPQSVVTQPAQTVKVTRQAATRTVTLPPVTNTQTVTATATSTAPGINTITTVTKEKPVVITRAQAVLSAFGLALLGALIGVLVLGAYRLGWFRGDAGNREFIEETVDDLKYNK
jgi:hypothetical protein